MNTQLTPGVAAMARGAATSGTQLPTGHVALDDREAFERMLQNIRDNEALLAVVKAHHTHDADGSLLSSFSRLSGMEEAEAIEVRFLRNRLGRA